MDTVYELAIIGAGPAGIATAIESFTLGMRHIVMLEKDENHNSTIRKFYKDGKRVDVDWKGQKVELDGTIHFSDGTKESTLGFFDTLLENASIELRTHTEVQKVTKKGDIFEIATSTSTLQAYYVVVTIGRMGKPNKPDYKIPPSIKNHVHFTLDGFGSGEKIMVVGAGDSAIEYALHLANNNGVTLCNRRDNFLKANPTNQNDIAKAIENKSITVYFNREIEEIEDDNGKIKVKFKNGESELFDQLLYAIGGTTPSGFLASSGILEEGGKPVQNGHYETNIEGVYVAGDITQDSGGSIALGLNHGMSIASHIINTKRWQEISKTTS